MGASRTIIGTAIVTHLNAPTSEPSDNPSSSPSTFALTATPTWLHEDQPENCCQWRRIDTLNSRSIISAQYQYIWRATNKLFVDNATESEYAHAIEYEQLYNLSVDPNYEFNLMNERDAEDTESALGQLVEEMRNLTRDYVEDVCIALSGECVLPGTNDTLGTAAPITPGPTAMPTTAAPTRRNGAEGRNGRNRERGRDEETAMAADVAMNGGSRISSDTAMVLMMGSGAVGLLLIGWQCVRREKDEGNDAKSVSYGACV